MSLRDLTSELREATGLATEAAASTMTCPRCNKPVKAHSRGDALPPIPKPHKCPHKKDCQMRGAVAACWDCTNDMAARERGDK